MATVIQRSLVDMAAEHAVLCVVEMLDLTWATLLLLDDPAQPDGGYVRHRATRLAAGAAYDREPHPHPERPLWPAALASPEPLEGDAGKEPLSGLRARQLGVRAYLAVSLCPSDASPPLGVLFLNRDHPTAFGDRDKTVARRLANRIADIINRARQESVSQQLLEAQRRQAEHAHALLVREQAARAVAELAGERLAFLAEVSATLAQSLDYHETLQQIVRLVVPVLADWCTLNIIEEDGHIRCLAVAHGDPAKEQLLRQIVDLRPFNTSSATGPGVALRTGRAVLVPEVSSADGAHAAADPAYRRLVTELGIRSLMDVPLVARGQTIGVLSCVASESRRRYGEADLALAEAVAERCAVAIDNARLYRSAQEAVATRERFIAVASHELRTPVTSISGFAQLLLRAVRQGQQDPEHLEHYVGSLLSDTQRLTQMTTELLDVSRLHHGTPPLQLERFDLAGRLQEVIARFEAQDHGKHRLVVHAPAGLPPLLADAHQIEQVMTNLLDNAGKYAPEGGDITVRLSEQVGGLLLEVRDQGIGLSPGAAAAIFEPFDRGANAQRLALPGLGLGLYICRTIAEAHGGRMWAESPGEGQGTTMSLWLPVEAKGPAA